MPSIIRPSINFDMRQEVHSLATMAPVVGFENTNDLPSGWNFDSRRWSSLFDLRLPCLPKLYSPCTQGLPEWEYFKSGVGDLTKDLKVQGIEEYIIDHERRWFPRVDNGWYFRWRTDYFYYSDHSNVQYISSSDNVDNRNTLLLDKEVEPSYPITVASYTRDPFSKVPAYNTRCSHVYKFTGLFVDEEEQSTFLPSTKTIIWSNVDTTKKEFVVDRSISGITKLIFNNDYITTVGKTPVSYYDLSTGDLLGASDGSEWQVFTLRNFPVVPDTFHLYIADESSGTWEEWVRAESYQELLEASESDPSNNYKYYYIDKDLGYVIFGDAESGVPPIGYQIVAMYDVTLRVEYEVKDTPMTINAIDADVSPVSQTTNQGFVCISHEELSPASISLKINKDLITFSNPATYGPVYIGNDYATLRAEVLSATGTPVPGVEVTFTVTPSTIGSIGNSTSGTAYGVTNGLGYAYSFYQPPTDASGMGFYATKFGSVIGDTLYLDNPTAGLTVSDDIYLYKILKDDPLLGMNFNEYLEDNLPDPPWYADPLTNPTEYEKWKQEMISIFSMTEWTTSPIPNGRKVIVYNWDGTAINPITGDTGAFVPTRPISIDAAGGALTYPTGALKSFDPYNTLVYPPYNEDIGSYWVVSTKYVEFQASCWSSFYNRYIYSNIIRVKVQLPRYLLGEYISEQLYKIPFGWKLYQDGDRNHAAGLDGATFLTINPTSGPYQIIDMVIDSDGDGIEDYFDPYTSPDESLTGVWVAAPENSVGLKIEISS